MINIFVIYLNEHQTDTSKTTVFTQGLYINVKTLAVDHMILEHHALCPVSRFIKHFHVGDASLAQFHGMHASIMFIHTMRAQL